MNGDGSRRNIPGKGVKKGAEQPEEDAIGVALRTVYDEAANEDIPPDMLDLLGKLD